MERRRISLFARFDAERPFERQTNEFNKAASADRKFLQQ
jgi:hypothetical protein